MSLSGIVERLGGLDPLSLRRYETVYLAGFTVRRGHVLPVPLGVKPIIAQLLAELLFCGNLGVGLSKRQPQAAGNRGIAGKGKPQEMLGDMVGHLVVLGTANPMDKDVASARVRSLTPVLSQSTSRDAAD